jgi:hypothetical protein
MVALAWEVYRLSNVPTALAYLILSGSKKRGVSAGTRTQTSPGNVPRQGLPCFFEGHFDNTLRRNAIGAFSIPR